MRKRRLLALAYLLALAGSYLAWAWREPRRELGADERAIALREVEGTRLGERSVELVLRERAPRAAGAAPLLLLHGSPGSKSDFDRLLPELDPRLRALAPDLPGFGESTHALPDYSIRAHARYVLQLLDALAIERAHVLGFSMGGGVALELAAAAPERVASLSLLAATGVQELELLGDHDLNHALHGLQLALVQTLRFGFPHFGAIEDFPLGLSYARNFWDSDQRPLRAALAGYPGPVLVLHGRGDFLVPIAAAHEHHRIAPQSELVLLPGGHFSLWLQPAAVAAAVTDFVLRAEAGRARTRAAASPERRAAAGRPFDPRHVPPLGGAALLVVLLIVALSTFVSEDLTCIAVGLMIGQGRIGFLPGVLAAFAGIFAGDVGLYLVGRLVGRPALARRPLRWIVSAAAIERAERWFERRGGRAIFLSRFLPGLRLPTYLAAGIVRARFLSFCGYFVLAGLLWTPLVVGLAAWVGVEAREWIAELDRWALPVLVALALALLAAQRLVVPLFSRRGRRLLVGALRRKLRWEFWPPWMFYVPVVLWIALLALRHRSLSVLAAANPGIPLGGFVGESKHEILAAFGQDAPFLPRTLFLPEGLGPGERRRRALAFLRAQALPWPVVVKPDAGQRGSGVHICRDAAELAAALERAREASLLQEHVAGPEFGVFYYRMPGEARGRIFAITEKLLPTVRGDGLRNLEQLILDDPRAVAMARVYLERNAARLFDVPAAGEELPIADIGTHCLGALFLDGSRHATPELEQAIDAISKRFEGFFFGRYDLRAPSVEALRAGRELTVLELNGLTSEATSIYDPRHGLFDAYRVLFRQWRLAFAIGRANLARGVQPEPWWRALPALRADRRRARLRKLAAAAPGEAGAPRDDPAPAPADPAPGPRGGPA